MREHTRDDRRLFGDVVGSVILDLEGAGYSFPSQSDNGDSKKRSGQSAYFRDLEVEHWEHMTTILKRALDDIEAESQ